MTIFKQMFVFVVILFVFGGLIYAKPYADGDLNRDGIVDFKDVKKVNEQWLDSIGGCSESNSPDIDYSQTVDLKDYALMASNWQTGGDFSVNRVIPDDSGAADVTKFPYYADNTGVTDSTSAINAALAAEKIVYLPNGTYLVSDSVLFSKSETILLGQSTLGTVIQLQDSCPGFEDGAMKPVVDVNYIKAQDTFRNYARNFTVDSGSGNPGAIGLTFYSNNVGATTDILIRSGDGQGEIGLNVDESLNGPHFVKNIHVIGFDIGYDPDCAFNSATEHIILENQNQYAVHSGSWANVVIRGLVSDNTCPVIWKEKGLLTLIDSVMTGGSVSNDAIILTNQANGFVRNVRSCGYNKTIESSVGTSTDVTDDYVVEYSSHGAKMLWTQDGTSINIPIEETPVPSWEEDMNEWANVDDYGANPGDGIDDSVGIQAAIDSGKSTVYLPHSSGGYDIDNTVYVRGNVKRVMCFTQKSIDVAVEPGFKVVDGFNSPAVIEFELPYFNPNRSQSAIVNASNRTLIIRFARASGGVHTGAGDCFMEDFGSGHDRFLEFAGGQNAWVKGLNIETWEEPQSHLVSTGSTVSVLGYKTENSGTYVEARNGASIEMLGHLAYTSNSGGYPMYKLTDSSFSGTWRDAYFWPDNPYNVQVRETHGGETRNFYRSSASIFGPFVGRKQDTAAPSAPVNLSASANGQHQIDLDWDDNSETDLKHYDVYRGTSSGFAIVAQNRIAKGVLVSQYSDTDLPGSTMYYYAVTAVDDYYNESSGSNEASATTNADTSAPSAPTGITTQAVSYDQINLDWSDNAESDLLGYNIYRSTYILFDPNSSTLIREAHPASSYFDDEGLDPETSYFYYIRAVDQSGNESGNSSLAAGTTWEYDITPPAIPTNLTVAAPNHILVELNWDDNTETDFSHYNIYKSQTTGFVPHSSNQIATGVTASWYNDTDVEPETTYYYLVTSVDNVGNESDPSSEGQVDVPTGDMTPPSSPVNLVAYTISQSNIELQWDDNTEPDLRGYNIYRDITSGFTPGPGNLIAGNVLINGYLDSGLSSTTDYFYKITAIDNFYNESTPSSEANDVTLASGALPNATCNWRFDEGTGSATNDSGPFERDGVLNGLNPSTSWVAGKYGTCISYDGLNNHYVNFAPYTGVLGDTLRTVTAWVKIDPAEAPGWNGICGWGDKDNQDGEGWNFYLEDGRPGVKVWEVWRYSNVSVGDGTWHHIAVVMPVANHNNIDFYVDGVKTGLDRTGGGMAINTQQECYVTVGAIVQPHNFNDKRAECTGLIDEVRIYNVALTATQIQQVMNNNGQ